MLYDCSYWLLLLYPASTFTSRHHASSTTTTGSRFDQEEANLPGASDTFAART
eukprot:COSAG05_NODE_14410_length_397_cov_1.449664_1_plen_52_part_01